MSVSGGFGISTNHFGQFDRGDYTWRENLTWIRGAHEFHFGMEMVRLSNELVNLRSPLRLRPVARRRADQFVHRHRP